MPPPKPPFSLSRVVNRSTLALTLAVTGMLMVFAFSCAAYPLIAYQILFGALYVGLYISNETNPRGVGKDVILLTIFVQSTCVVFGSEFAVPPVYAYLPSFLACAMMCHERRAIYGVTAVHVLAIALGWVYVPAGTLVVAYLPCATFITVVLALVIAAELDAESNWRYWAKDRALAAELAQQEGSLTSQTQRARRQSVALERVRGALAAREAENAVQIVILRSVNEERVSLARAAGSDLKEPLRGISSFIQLIGRRLTRLGLVEEVREYLDYITDGAARMNTMVDDLLRYSDFQHAPHAEPVATARVLAMICDNLSDLLNREGATIELAADLPVVPGHTTQVVQLFQNLISNGIKFRRPDVPPRCEVGWEAREDGVEFYVRDNGIGIPAARLGDVFGLFTRLHERGSYEGTGIGLALCRRIVLAAGGEIWAESEEGEGTTFRFTWPTTGQACLPEEGNADARGVEAAHLPAAALA